MKEINDYGVLKTHKDIFIILDEKEVKTAQEHLRDIFKAVISGNKITLFGKEKQVNIGLKEDIDFFELYEKQAFISFVDSNGEIKDLIDLCVS